MSAPQVLNTRILHVQNQSGQDPVVILGLSHFGTNSRMVFQCTCFPSREPGMGRWGVLPIEASGNAFSYFGQFVGELALSGNVVPLNSKAQLSQYNVNRIQALANAVAFLLNEYHGENSIVPELTMDDIHQQLDDKTFLLSVDEDPSSPLKMVTFLLPLQIAQADFAIAMAKLHKAFNVGVPAHFLYGNNTPGNLPDLLAAAEERKAKSH
jgi:hypothetical protein